MNPPAFEPERAEEQTVPASETSKRDGLPERGLLEKVLRQTLSDESSERLDPADLDALREVARTHRGRPLVLDPVAVDLVHAVLCVQFPDQHQSSLSKTVSAEIARTLFEDAVSRKRLEAIWKHLGEIAP